MESHLQNTEQRLHANIAAIAAGVLADSRWEQYLETADDGYMSGLDWAIRAGKILTGLEPSDYDADGLGWYDVVDDTVDQFFRQHCPEVAVELALYLCESVCSLCGLDQEAFAGGSNSDCLACGGPTRIVGHETETGIPQRPQDVEHPFQAEADKVNHPRHYNEHPSGVEAIQICEHMNFCLGNVIKYVWRADSKAAPLEDLKKAAWYLQREIQRREHSKGGAASP